ncbi:hypothetical protein ABZ319_07665 [Nocardia sp. NPDC005978]|uniref:hypothetical protein n=1 Tax=Nocardia sp. NPDC005978 TaxID=3156725 RepID=UPI0033BE59C2
MGTRSDMARRIVWGTTSLAFASALTALAAAPASALDIELSPGQSFTVGTAYTISYHTDVEQTGHQIVFTDNGECFTGRWVPGRPAYGSSNKQQPENLWVGWTPTTPGPHTITATMNGRTVSQTVYVTPALGGTPPLLPNPRTGCDGPKPGGLRAELEANLP